MPRPTVLGKSSRLEELSCDMLYANLSVSIPNTNAILENAL